ncbi:Retinoic acid induced 16-like protein-domain-containing protein [Phycomyces blakesleeanus]|uniref:Retinoic acid induced 16-like protein-domain-containing protein n=1 Tax=Phycomyces blakesleeanus TaxID=4837 RepID=A0ABR3BDD7_PHYBL
MKKQGRKILVNVSEKSDYPAGVRGEAIRTVASMVDLLDDRFLVHNAVHKPTIKLLRFCVLDERQSEHYHEDLVDLMYIICSKIHGFPALLNIFFHDKQWLTTPQKTTFHLRDTRNTDPKATTQPDDPKKPEYEFLLFTYLLRFVHREGRTGDFARTGLLFLMEMATEQLGDFILESDFATIMAAGLGALYSQLPRKLVVKDEAELRYDTASYLLGQDDMRPVPLVMGLAMSSSVEFKSQIDSFLKLLEFCQDVLTRCPNVEISFALLKSIRTIFLDNILYPSILECSDIDGSSVAVISYIDLILQTLQQEELSSVIVGFLMDETAEENVRMERKSSNVYAGVESDPIKSSPYFTAVERFTLKDLIFSRLKSISQPTVIATLKLLKTLITHHCRYSLLLLSIIPDTEKNQQGNATIISHHLREMELYFSLLTSIDNSHAKEVSETGYDSYLQDIEATLERDGCYVGLTQIDPPSHGRPHKARRRRSFKYGQRLDDSLPNQEEEDGRDLQTLLARQSTHFRHHIRPTDPLLQILLGLLSHFFAQSPELNLALTGVIAALALCPYRSLEGWISFREADRTSPEDILLLDNTPQPEAPDRIRSKDIYAHFDSSCVDEDDSEDDRSIDFGLERNSTQMTSPTYFKSFPPFFTLYRTLTQQVDYYRSELDEFDELLDERRQGLHEEVTERIPSQAHHSIYTQPPAVLTMSASTSTRRPSLHPKDTPPPTMNGRRPSVLLRPSVSTGTATVKPPSPVQPLPSNPITSNPLSRLAMHARKTQDMRIQPLFPSNFISEFEEPILDLDAEDEDTFAPKSNPSQSRRMDKSTEISIAMLLNNVVILEEAIKELIALMQVRHSLGIDTIQYT